MSDREPTVYGDACRNLLRWRKRHTVSTDEILEHVRAALTRAAHLSVNWAKTSDIAADRCVSRQARGLVYVLSSEKKAYADRLYKLLREVEDLAEQVQSEVATMPVDMDDDTAERYMRLRGWTWETLGDPFQPERDHMIAEHNRRIAEYIATHGAPTTETATDAA